LYNGIFKFPDGAGVPIGSPLGSTLAELFMSKFEEEFFDAYPQFHKNIIYWYRYVDDVLLLWDGPVDVF